MVLQNIEDVTAEVQAADKPGLSAAEAGRLRAEIISGIERRAAEKTGLRSSVVTLYAGGRFHLYQYRVFNDVRLVFAPEQQITFFGGDPDNYGYPRYCLDISFFRVYENGKPYRTPHHLKWNTSGLREGELVFAAGNPMSTPRLKTISQLEFLRDHEYPFENKSDLSQRDILERFITEGEEQKRVGWMRLWGALNSIKCVNGLIGGLSDASLMETKARNEKEHPRRGPEGSLPGRPLRPGLGRDRGSPEDLRGVLRRPPAVFPAPGFQHRLFLHRPGPRPGRSEFRRHQGKILRAADLQGPRDRKPDGFPEPDEGASSREPGSPLDHGRQGPGGGRP